VTHPVVGAIYDPESRTTVFRVWAPFAAEVSLVLDNKRRDLRKEKYGYWMTEENAGPGMRYGYLIDGKGPYPDPASLAQPDGVHQLSQVVHAELDWSDQEWKGVDAADLILYEIHTGTFSEEGTFEGIIQRLPYLQALGITGIELMPVAQFPGNRNWGYDGVLPYCIHHDYGGINGFLRLVNEAHHHGIAVILDVVYNHLGPEGNYLELFGPYFTDKYRTNWGKAINFDDRWCDGVRNFFIRQARYFLETCRVDGLRLDAVHAIHDESALHLMRALSAEVKAIEKETGRRKLLIGEIDLNDPRYISEEQRGGYGLDAQWMDEFHHAVRAYVTGERDGYYEDFGELDHVVRAFRDSYVYTGQYSIHRKRNFGVPVDLPYDRFVVFMQNHDQIGNRLFGDRLSSRLTQAQLKFLAAVTILSPHIPLIFMGEEYGERRPFQYFISHTDEQLVEAVRKGRREEFSYFTGEGDTPDPQSEKTFLACKLSWDTDGHHTGLLELYRSLIHFRRHRPAMKNYDRNHVRVWPVHDKVLAVERIHPEDHLVMFFNFGHNAGVYPNFYPRAKRIFDTSSLVPDEYDQVWRNQNQYVHLAPWSVTIYEI